MGRSPTAASRLPTRLDSEALNPTQVGAGLKPAPMDGCEVPRVTDSGSKAGSLELADDTDDLASHLYATGRAIDGRHLAVGGL
jgi:hypothetical protein